MAVIIGFACGLIVVAMFMGGAATGWALRGRVTRAEPPVIDEKEKKELKEAHEAFQTMMNYSADTAYQIGSKPGGDALK